MVHTNTLIPNQGKEEQMAENTQMTHQPKTLKEYIEIKRPEIQSMLPSHVNLERFVKSALLAVSRDPELQKCTPLSLFTSVVNAAELGLLFTPAKGHAYLVKFGNQAQLMVGYRGFIDLAKRTGDVARIEAHLVCENDKFELEYGTNSRLVHVPKINGDRGKMIGAYAVAHFKDGEYQFEYMDKESIDGIRARSKAKNSPAWQNDFGEMARKTVVRRLFKYLPSSSDLLDKAIEADNKAVGFEDIAIEPLADGDKTANLAQKLADAEEADVEIGDSNEAEEQAEVVDEDTGEVIEPKPEPTEPSPPPVTDFGKALKEEMKFRNQDELKKAAEACGIKKAFSSYTQKDAEKILNHWKESDNAEKK